MNLIFTLDANYIPPLKVFLYSIFEKNKKETNTIYLLYRDMPDNLLEEVETLVHHYGHDFFPIDCSEEYPSQMEWPTSRYYSIEMYDWLMAPFFLPKDVKKGLYLDPDIVCLNDFSDWYHQPFNESYFKAASHNYVTKFVEPFNKLRLQNYSSEGYFNSGVVLMNLEAVRKHFTLSDILDAIDTHKNKLILPDQDIFNLLFSDRIEEVEWREFNMAPFIFEMLTLLFPNEYHMDQVKEEVIFLHYMGENKPWDKREDYKYQLGSFYFEYEKEAKKKFPSLF